MIVDIKITVATFDGCFPPAFRNFTRYSRSSRLGIRPKMKCSAKRWVPVDNETWLENHMD
jgi:hypothetical protein